MKKQKSRKKDYTNHTDGSKLEAETRKLANALTEEERTEALEGARSLIFGAIRH